MDDLTKGPMLSDILLARVFVHLFVQYDSRSYRECLHRLSKPNEYVAAFADFQLLVPDRIVMYYYRPEILWIISLRHCHDDNIKMITVSTSRHSKVYLHSSLNFIIKYSTLSCRIVGYDIVTVVVKYRKTSMCTSTYVWNCLTRRCLYVWGYFAIIRQGSNVPPIRFASQITANLSFISQAYTLCNEMKIENKTLYWRKCVWKVVHIMAILLLIPQRVLISCRIYASVNRVSIGSGLACHLFGAKALPEPMLAHCQLDLKNKLQWNSNQNTKLFIEENAFKKCRLRNGGHFVPGEMS